MKDFVNKISIDNLLKFFQVLFLIILPWQTIWITREVFFEGVKWQYGTLGFYGSEFLAWILVITFIIWLVLNKFRIQNSEFRISGDRVFVFFCLVFSVYVLASSMWAGNSSLAWQQGLRIMLAMISFFIFYLGPLSRDSVLNYFIYGSILPSVLGIWQFIFQSSFSSTLLGLSSHPAVEAGTSIVSSIDIGRVMRAYGPFSHPNIFGGYLFLSIVFISLLIYKNFEHRISRILYSTIFILNTFALFFTFSRSAWLATLVWLIIFLVFIIWQKKPYLLVVPAIFGLIFFILTFINLDIVKVRFGFVDTHEILSIEERINTVGEASGIISGNPWFGVGAGNYTYKLILDNPDRHIWTIEPVHNFFLLFLAELGFFGSALLLGVIISFIFCIKVYFGAKNWFLMGGLVLAFLPIFMFDHYIYSSLGGLYLLVLGLVSLMSGRRFFNPSLLPSLSTVSSTVNPQSWLK